jgi:hypothetical protein
MTMTAFVATIAFGAGGALIWFCKDKIQTLVIDGNKLSAKWHAKADAIAAAAKKI